MSYRGHREGCYGNVQILQRVHAKRSSRTKRIDESLRAPLAKSDDEWLAQPNRFDIPDVDTPQDRASEEEQKRRLEEIRQFEATHSPTSHSRFRANIARHKLYGVTH